MIVYINQYKIRLSLISTVMFQLWMNQQLIYFHLFTAQNYYMYQIKDLTKINNFKETIDSYNLKITQDINNPLLHLQRGKNFIYHPFPARSNICNTHLGNEGVIFNTTQSDQQSSNYKYIQSSDSNKHVISYTYMLKLKTHNDTNWYMYCVTI